MIIVNWYDPIIERYLYVELLNKDQSRIDITMIDSGPGDTRLQLDKKQVSELIVALVNMHAEML